MALKKTLKKNIENDERSGLDQICQRFGRTKLLFRFTFQCRFPFVGKKEVAESKKVN